jgi:NADH-quinone oxidoreductase subunit L
MNTQMPNSIIVAIALVPLLPLLVAGITALLNRNQRALASGLAVGAQAGSLLLATYAFFWLLGQGAAEGETARAYWNFTWMATGEESIRLGLLLDPLNAGMLVMVTLVSLLIFIYSTAYMKEDWNYTRFFCFLSLFSAGMLGLVVANSLLLLFIAWELVGVASFLLIGFWFHKPAAAAAARKAFITTRIGDLGFFLGMMWLYSECGTLLFYDGGAGVLEAAQTSALAHTVVGGGMAASTAIALLLFCGAAGKSGQLPLHVWLPDAMEGPTPVSALIHAATMVAAGVFLVARAFPIFSASVDPDGVATALMVVAWVGAATALFAACIAVAQNDIKRILAYSTVSQLGFMMLALGAGSVSAAMFHLIAHAFFKALLFLGAGSVIHACHEEQDIRQMGGLGRMLPRTFIPYAAGMMALAGVPFFFSGFWTKEGILHAAHEWQVSQGPFLIALVATFLTAFYMTRQVARVFFGKYRGHAKPHESPPAMVVPLWILGAAAILLSLFATPAWPWYNHFITGDPLVLDISMLLYGLGLMVASIVLVGFGIGLGWMLYGRGAPLTREVDPLEQRLPGAYRALGNRLWVDELYGATVLRLFRAAGQVSAWLETYIWGGAVNGVGGLVRGGARAGAAVERSFVNRTFDFGCRLTRFFGEEFSLAHTGRVQAYLRFIGLGVVGLLVLYAWIA